MDQDGTWHGVDLSPGDFVLDGDPAPLPKRGRSTPNFWPMFIVTKRLDGSRWHLAWRQATLRTQPPPPKVGGGGRAPPQFSAHFYCGQTAGCIKMPLGMKVGLSPRDSVLHGDPAPLPKRGRVAPNFRSMSVVAK